MITLSHSGFELKLAPEQGGCVVSFKSHDTHLLRPADLRQSQSWDARDFAAFPMLPFVGRIDHGQFAFAGRSVALPANMPPEPHAIHGLGWQSSWEVESVTQTEVLLTHTHDGSVWPWTYQARQRFELTETGLSLSLSLTNTSQQRMPAGFGWHPYFPKAEAHLKAPAIRTWTGQHTAPETASIIPETDLRQTRLVDELALDTAFDVAPQPIEISWPGRRLIMTSEPIFSKLTIFTPQDARSFCVEPITHAPNALNMNLDRRETGLRILEPSQTFTGTIRLDVEILS
ncbi:MAG: aldose 1-epimerase [Pseudomonadota bacterium]